MKNSKHHYLLISSISFFFLFFLFVHHANAQQTGKSIGLVAGLSFQKMEIITNLEDPQIKSAIGFQFGGRVLVPISKKINLTSLQFDLLIQNRQFKVEFDSSTPASMVETELQFKPVFVQSLPFGDKWDGYGKIGINTSYALRRKLTIGQGPQIKFEGFKNLFSAGLILGGGVINKSGFLVEISTTADFLRPDKNPTNDPSVSVSRSLMSAALAFGWMF